MTTENHPRLARRPARASRTGSLVGGLALGVLIAGMGAMFTSLLVKGYGFANETREWEQVPMVVTRSEVIEERVADRPPEFKAVVEYQFTYDGRRREGRGIKRVEGFTKHKSKAEARAERWPVGTEGVCFVNPADPRQTVLKHDTRAVLYTVWFPGLFVVAGLGIAIGAVRSFWLTRPGASDAGGSAAAG